MGIEVKVTFTPEEYDLVRECVEVTFELTKFYVSDKTAQRLTDLKPRRVKILAEYLESGKHPRHGVSV